MTNETGAAAVVVRRPTLPLAGGWGAALLLAVVTVAALRLLLSSWAALTLALIPAPYLPTQYGQVGVVLQTGGLAAPWEREDALWYEKIAAQGYSPADNSPAFFPLLPLLMRAASPLTGGNIALAGLLVASLAAVAALALLYRLAGLDMDSPAAARAVAYLALFPTAFFLYAAFTESVFLAISLGAFWCARQGRWGWAAGLVVLAGLTKLQGAFLGLPLAVEYLVVATPFAHHGDTETRRTNIGFRITAPLRLGRALLAVGRRRLAGAGALAAAGALGTGAFFAYLTYVVGDPLPWPAHETLAWGQRVTWPGETLVVAVQHVLLTPNIVINLFDLVVLLTFTVLTVAAFRIRPSYGLYAAIILGATWVHVGPQFPLMSASRFVLVAFPCFLVLARWAGRRPRLVHLGLVLVWGSGLLFWSFQFVHGHWVG